MTSAILRCDGDASIGLGHVMRCRALADAFTAQGWRCWFAMSPETAALTGEHEPILVSPGLDGAPAVAAAIEARAAHCLVVDDYRLDGGFETVARGPAKVVIAIDDLANRRHECDMIVDSNPGRSAADYAGLVRSDTRFLLGPNHVLLRRAVVERRPRRAGPAPGRPRRLLITMGGADPEDFSSHVLTALRHTGPLAEQVLLIIGPANPRREQLAAAAAAVGVEYAVNPEDLVIRMAASNMAVTAGGVGCWELACLGVPTVMLLTAANQRAIVRAVHDAGAGIGLDAAASRDPRRIADAMQMIAADRSLRQRMSSAGRTLVDGRGAERVAAAAARLVAAANRERCA